MRPAARADDLPQVQPAVLHDAADGLVPAALASEEDVEGLPQLGGVHLRVAEQFVDEPVERARQNGVSVEYCSSRLSVALIAAYLPESSMAFRRLSRLMIGPSERCVKYPPAATARTITTTTPRSRRNSY